MRWILKDYRFALLLMFFGPAAAVNAADNNANCDSVSAQLVSLQGSVEVQKTPENPWKKAELNGVYCTGASIRTLDNSRATLTLSNHSQLRLKENTTLNLTALKATERTWLDLLKGALHVITRVPRSLTIKTPYVNAAVEGTEFLVDVTAQQTLVSVFEGTVQGENPHGKINLGAWKSLLAKQGEAPQAYLVVKPRDGVLWSLYYPPVMDFKPTEPPHDQTNAWQGAMARSIDAYRHGDLITAFKEIGDYHAANPAVSYYIYRASLRLSVGLIQGAQADLDFAQTLEKDHSDVLALQAIIAVVKNEKDQALTMAQQAVAKNANSPPAYIALSYAQQAHLQLDLALKSALKATQLDQHHAIAWARLAEMQLSHGELKKALQAAQQAVILHPLLERTQTILGFAYLTQYQVAEAKVAFHMAIAFDSAAPLPRLGLGLAKIKEGDLKDGRLQLEIAASLDPGNSLVRSYLGKAYFAEKRDKLAQSQYDLAKELDPNDPTPWLYSAFQWHLENQPIKAFESLQKSISLNENRAVYHSRLLLDQDLSTKSVSLANIYADMGFSQRAIVEGVNSLLADYSNPSAHVFLKDAYAAIPRYDFARNSELLQAQMLQPVNAKPVGPTFTANDFSNMNTTSVLSREQSSSFFDNRKLLFEINSVAGNEKSMSDEMIISGRDKKMSFRMSQFHSETEGFRENADIKQDVYYGFAQAALASDLNIQAETSNQKIESGDLILRFDSNRFFPDYRENFQEYMRRLGLAYSISTRTKLLYSIIEKDTKFHISDKVPLTLANSYRLINSDSRVQGLLNELQLMFSDAKFSAIIGTGNLGQDIKSVLRRDRVEGGAIVSSSPVNSAKIEAEFNNYYTYINVNFRKKIDILLALSYDKIQRDNLERNQLSPKFGLLWRPYDVLIIRMAGFRTLRRPVQFNQTLEPSHILGFNQFYDDLDATSSKRYGLGVDLKIPQSTLVGMEISTGERREFGGVGANALQNGIDNERYLRAYFYKAFTRRTTINIDLLHEYSDRRDLIDIDNFFEVVKTQNYQLPIEIRNFFEQGIFCSFVVRYVDQKVFYRQENSSRLKAEKDNFWLADVKFGYKYKNKVTASFGVKNIFDTKFHYQSDTAFDTGMTSLPGFQPSRHVFVSLNVNF